MSIPLLVNGITYNYPALDDEGWGPDASNWAVAITQNIISKSGGLFSLTGDLDFGPNFGIKSVYYKTRSANLATTGNFRLANSDLISFRNAGNTGNLNFGTGSIDAVPTWNGIDLVNLSTAQTLTNKTFTSPNINTSLNILSQGVLHLQDATNTGYVNIRASTSQTPYTFTLPAAVPSPDTFLKFNGTDWIWDTALGSGTVTYVDMTVPSILNISGNPITGSGTFAVTLADESANLVFAGPTTGLATTPTFRSLVVADLPSISSGLTGTLPISNGGTGSTVVNNNLVFAGPNTGGPLAPSFRALLASDLPAVPLTTGVSGILPIANGGTNASSKSVAFDNLSPMNTLGDMISGGVSGTNIRLPVGTEGQLLKVASGIPSWQPDMPIGIILPYAGSSTPSGWLNCDGSIISRTTYASLFAVIGTTFGIGDGFNTFGLPDLRGRIIAGLDNMGTGSANRITDPQADILGGSMGEESHTLTANENGAHSHTVSASGSDTTGNNNQSHQHRQQCGNGSSTTVYPAYLNDVGGNGNYRAISTQDSESNAQPLYTDNQTGNHNHNFSVNVSGSTNTSPASTTAHNNLQPTFALNYIIKIS